MKKIVIRKWVEDEGENQGMEFQFEPVEDTLTIKKTKGGERMNKTLWKSMLAGPKSANGDEGVWKIGEWRKHDGELSMCNAGYHASRNVIDSMGYVNAEVIARVEVRGKHLEQGDKQCWEQMRIVKAWTWMKKDSVRLAVYAAELVIGIFEKEYPDDKRPRQAIEATKNWLAEPTEKNRLAARDAAGEAWAAGSAAWAAGSATWAARSAAWAAGGATWAARSAAWAARSAAGEAGAKCHRFVLRILKEKDKEEK
jgi:hypothetical protein